jgi:hypothetical protein
MQTELTLSEKGLLVDCQYCDKQPTLEEFEKLPRTIKVGNKAYKLKSIGEKNLLKDTSIT